MNSLAALYKCTQRTLETSSGFNKLANTAWVVTHVW